ncbi:hypothetical protein GCM10023223_20710 [Stackebrandtia albiflava]
MAIGLVLTAAGCGSPAEVTPPTLEPEWLQFRAVTATAPVAPVDEPVELTGDPATDVEGVWRRVGEEAAALARGLDAPVHDAADTEVLAPFGALTAEEVALLPAEVRLYTPSIHCEQLVPGGDFLDPATDSVLCDTGATAEAATKLWLAPAALDGGDVAEAEAVSGPSDPGSGVVRIRFSEAGTDAWAELTGAQMGERVAIVLGTEVLSAPTVQQAITEGTTDITGGFTPAEAEELVRALTVTE